MPPSERNPAWRQIARRSQLKINLAWWLDRFAPLLTISSMIAAVLLLYLRSQDQSPSQNTLLATAAGTLALLAITAWLRARPQFISEREVYVQLDQQLHLHNALTTADHGIGPWPALPVDKVSNRLRWHWPRIATPLAISVILLLAAWYIPVTPQAFAALPPASQPLAWEQMDNWLETLEESELIEEPSLDEVKEKLEKLRAQDQEKWFSHSSMEASDSLRDSLDQQIRQLGSNLEDTERNLNAFQNFSEQMTDATKNQLLQDYQKAMKQLGLGQLPLDSKLMSALKSLDPSQFSKLSQLSQKQLDQLREQLKKGAKALKELQLAKGGNLPGFSDQDMIAFLMQENLKGPGRGGIQRGPGEAPITLGQPNDLNTNNLSAVQNQDLSHAAPGDIIATGKTEHDIDKSHQGPQSAGAVKSKGQGGDAIWKDALMPAEKELLKRYFTKP
ncbi:MAG: hypothetical protein L3J39_10700 [Verrucomicrobiales bacterium]|nr:hypothetical protein [Verrucomicrobiales bacterium]